MLLVLALIAHILDLVPINPLQIAIQTLDYDLNRPQVVLVPTAIRQPASQTYYFDVVQNLQ